jgi:hypothetical protein
VRPEVSSSPLVECCSAVRTHACRSRLNLRMVADPERLKVYADERAPGQGTALSIARSDTVHVGHPLIPERPLGVLDPDWIPAVAARGLVVIGRDRRIRTKPEEVRQVMAAGLRVLQIGGKRRRPERDPAGSVVHRRPIQRGERRIRDLNP